MGEEIDAVFTWVDGNDQKWLEKKSSYLRVGSELRVNQDINTDVRYIDSNEIYYSIRFLRKNAPWVRKVFLVVDQQAPSWMTNEKKEELNVIIIDHRDIFKGYENALPVFNSMTIEMMLSRIPGLSERFLYLNDDFFIMNPVSTEDFFQGSALIVRGRVRFKSRLLDRLYKSLSRINPTLSRNRGGYIGRLPKNTRLPRRLSYIELAHAAHGVYKDDFNRVIDKSFIRSNIHYRFRVKGQVSPFSYVLNWASKYRKVSLKNDDWKCIYASNIFSNDGNLVLNFEELSKFKFVCFNDLSNLEPKSLKIIHHKLDKELSR